MLNILVLCTGNSARSILGECALNHLGKGRFRAFSAGSHPTGRVNPFALAALAEAGIPADGVSSKSWDLFAQTAAPKLDLLITVCDNAAGETCPLFNTGNQQPAKVHWGYPDPAAVVGDDAEKHAAFAVTLANLTRRIQGLVDLDKTTSLSAMSRDELARAVQGIPA